MFLIFSGLIQVVLENLQIEYPTNIGTHNVYVRKLPNTRLRKDVEIARLKDYEVIKNLNFISFYDKLNTEKYANRVPGIIKFNIEFFAFQEIEIGLLDHLENGHSS